MSIAINVIIIAMTNKITMALDTAATSPIRLSGKLHQTRELGKWFYTRNSRETEVCRTRWTLNDVKQRVRGLLTCNVAPINIGEENAGKRDLLRRIASWLYWPALFSATSRATIIVTRKAEGFRLF
jgi:hypothetical protein